MGRVEKKVCVVTGAAMGLGEATARLLAREGARVVLTDLKDAEGEAVAASIRKAGGDALYLHHDVADEGAWEEVMKQTVAAHGRLDALVNNAGVVRACPPHEQTLESWRWLMSINLDGVFLGTKHAMRTMMAANPGTGSIVNLSSIAGLVGIADVSAYCASKGAVSTYTKAVALYCGREKLGIRVNSVHPAYIWTPMVENHLKSLGDLAEGRKAADAAHPIGHMGAPDDVAYAVLYLVSDEAKLVTGAETVVDGGYTAQ